MAIPQIVTVKLAAASANNICLSQTPVSGTALVIAGSAASGGVATLDAQRRVLVTYGNEGSARTMVISGTNGAGFKISETVAIPSGGSGTVATLQDFLTLTTGLPAGGGFTAAVTVGTNTVGSSPWKNLSGHVTPGNTQIACVVSGAAVNYQVEVTSDSLVEPLTTTVAGAPAGPNGPTVPVPTPMLALANQPVNNSVLVTAPVQAWRLTVNSGTGSVTATGIQAGLRQ